MQQIFQFRFIPGNSFFHNFQEVSDWYNKQEHHTQMYPNELYSCNSNFSLKPQNLVKHS